MDWFKLRDDVIDNPKLRLLPAETYRFWTLLLCVANRSTVRGTLPDPEEIAFRTRYDLASAHAMIEALTAQALVERCKGKLRISKWELFQKPMDSSAERSRRYRERVRERDGAHPPSAPDDDERRDDRYPRALASRDADALASRDGRHPKREREREETPSESSSLDSLGKNPPQSSPPEPPPARSLSLTADPAEVAAVCLWANGLVMGWGPLAEGACLRYSPAWVREACGIAFESKLSRFRAVETILGRFKAQGCADSERPVSQQIAGNGTNGNGNGRVFLTAHEQREQRQRDALAAVRFDDEEDQ